MLFSLPLGWLQLKHQKLRLLAAIMGITFAVMLIFVQLEFRDGLFVSAVRYHTALDYDLAMVNPKTSYLLASRAFPRNRLYQTAAIKGVKSVTPVYLGRGIWRNPVDRSRSREIFVLAFDPSDAGFDNLLSPTQKEVIKLPDKVIFDRLGREEYGPVVDLYEAGNPVSTEVNDRELSIEGLYSNGTSFGIDGGLITSDLNYRRMFPRHNKSLIHLGLVKADAGHSVDAVQARIRESIPRDVQVMTREEFAHMDINHWNNTTPIGYIFAFGAIMGLIVGIIIVYQILFADVQDHLKEYATLKAMGYSHSYLRNVVLQEAIILGILGFIPGAGLSHLMFGVAGDATGLPLEMSRDSLAFVFGLTLIMCAGSGVLALRKLRAVDPADVF